MTVLFIQTMMQTYSALKKLPFLREIPLQSLGIHTILAKHLLTSSVYYRLITRICRWLVWANPLPNGIIFDPWDIKNLINQL